MGNDIPDRHIKNDQDRDQMPIIHFNIVGGDHRAPNRWTGAPVNSG